LFESGHQSWQKKPAIRRQLLELSRRICRYEKRAMMVTHAENVKSTWIEPITQIPLNKVAPVPL
jgi:predicted translin family RNA/ssDNA-binding protein